MEKFTTIISSCLAIETENIDTDQIVPARFLKLTGREGFGKYLFYDWRFDQKGKRKNIQFKNLNHQTAQILVVGNNFGCGSSREHAVWALLDFGFQAVISSSFGDIFYNNALKNGLLPVTLRQKELEKLFTMIKTDSGQKITVDLKKQQVLIPWSSWEVKATPGSQKDSGQARMTKEYIIFLFPLDSFHKTCLLKGVDELGYILSHKKQIEAFEDQHRNYLIKD